MIEHDVYARLKDLGTVRKGTDYFSQKKTVGCKALCWGASCFGSSTTVYLDTLQAYVSEDDTRTLRPSPRAAS